MGLENNGGPTTVKRVQYGSSFNNQGSDHNWPSPIHHLKTKQNE
jgi:hypothetical protein